MAAPFLTEYTNVFEFFNNYVFGDVILTIMGFAMLLFLLGIIFRMGLVLNIFLCGLFLFTMTLLLTNQIFALIVFVVGLVWLIIEWRTD